MMVVSTLQTKSIHNWIGDYVNAKTVVSTLETKSNHNVYYIFK
jgi:hypothetical protein